MSPAAATKRATRRNEHSEISEHTHRERARFLAASRRSDDTALLVPVAFVLAATGRAGLLAHDADDHVGFHPILRDAERELLRSRGGNADRRGAALGHSISRAARLLHIVPRRNVVAQYRQSDDEPAAAVRIHYLAHDHEPHSTLARRYTGDGVGAAVLRLQPLRLGVRPGGFFHQPDADQLGSRHFCFGAGDTERARRGEFRLVDHVSVHAVDLRLLPSDDATGLAAVRRVAPAADLCLRRHAGTFDPSDLSGRPHARRVGAERGVLRRRRIRIPQAFAERPAPWLADANRRVGQFAPPRVRTATYITNKEKFDFTLAV